MVCVLWFLFNENRGFAYVLPEIVIWPVLSWGWTRGKIESVWQNHIPQEIIDKLLKDKYYGS